MISVNALRPADIICSTTDAAVSAVIRAGIGASVSHCILYVGGSFVIEAVGEGVRRRPLAEAIEGANLAIAGPRGCIRVTAIGRPWDGPPLPVRRARGARAVACTTGTRRLAPSSSRAIVIATSWRELDLRAAAAPPSAAPTRQGTRRPSAGSRRRKVGSTGAPHGDAHRSLHPL
jgi:hypothetical protein